MCIVRIRMYKMGKQGVIAEQSQRSQINGTSETWQNNGVFVAKKAAEGGNKLGYIHAYECRIRIQMKIALRLVFSFETHSSGFDGLFFVLCMGFCGRGRWSSMIYCVDKS